MARKKLFGNTQRTSCDVCEAGQLSADGEAVLCPHKGVVPTYYHCRRFRYDPLKRVPQRSRPLGEFSVSDFSLEELPLDDYIQQEVSDPVTTDHPTPDAAEPANEPLSAETINRLLAFLHDNESPTAAQLIALLQDAPDDNAEDESTAPPDEFDAYFLRLRAQEQDSVTGSVQAALRDGALCLAEDLSEQDLDAFADETFPPAGRDTAGASVRAALAAEGALCVLPDGAAVVEPGLNTPADELVLLSVAPEDELIQDESEPADDGDHALEWVELSNLPNDEEEMTLSDLPTPQD